MTHDDLRLPDYLGHILDAIERIERYTAGMDEVAFAQNSLVQDAVVRNFEIIGEASRNIIKRHRDFAAANPNLPLAVAYEMRNAVAHGYFKVDLGIVWKTVRDDLDALKRSVASALIEVCTNHGLAGADHDE
ncbi:DUF86 domain-containing protein [Thiomonas sp. FB-Cd]|uniref:HepT-like ribonuclease domain-containing protein n=1 Tax=Thiomonas sp. FB-Cd TaxID=1158292 RepID=UPI0005706C0D|nr:DUF86 domain-containing protein [Thiomonas sp. FB-Cd]